jgi:TRAP-type mannitol/chloroaromatic compound transport system substrate-binding protein
MKRRNFVTTAGLASAGGLLAACKGKQPGGTADCAETGGQQTHEWTMVTAWPRDFPALGTGASRLAERIGQMSGGRLTVKVYGGNELVPPFEVFDAVEQGTAEMGHATPYYWKGKIPAAQFFTGVPFGLTAQEINGWFYYGDGLDLWREAYAPFGIIPYPVGNSGAQMGGWFNKEINSLEDLKGLKMRIPGLGGEVLKRAGGTPQNIPGAEIFTALQTGTIDATEWVGPLNDQAYGLQQAARYYYYPGWHEPGSALEALVNREAFEALPEDLRHIVEYACQAANMDMLSEYAARNGEALQQMREAGVDIRAFPDDVLRELARLTGEVLQQIAEEDALSGRVYASFKSYYAQVRDWGEISEKVILDLRQAERPLPPA